MRRWIHIYCITAFFAALLGSAADALTLDEAISLAKEKLPSYKASAMKVKSAEALYTASLSPYLPSVDASTSQKEYDESSKEPGSRYDLSISYLLFDGWKSGANRSIAGFNLDIEKEELRKNLIDLEFNVKTAFYAAIAQREISDQRRQQLEYARKDHEIAQGRHKHGIARLSDVLQALVRLEQAQFNLIEAEGAFNKAFSELNSIIGRPLDTEYDIPGLLDAKIDLPDRSQLSEAALKRPEIKQAENSLKIAEKNKSIAVSAFYPVLSLSATYTRNNGGGLLYSPEEKSAGITATWNIFELGKFYKRSSAEFDRAASLEKLNDLKRKVLLEVHKAYEDFMTAYNKLNVAEEQLRHAQHNYAQAFGEYKAGKADMLSLVQAESLLASAKEQLINSTLNLIMGRALLERVAAI